MDREEDRTPAQSRAYAGAVSYLRRGEAGRQLALALLTERGGYPAERAATMVETILGRQTRRRAARTAASPRRQTVAAGGGLTGSLLH